MSLPTPSAPWPLRSLKEARGEPGSDRTSENPGSGHPHPPKVPPLPSPPFRGGRGTHGGRRREEGAARRRARSLRPRIAAASPRRARACRPRREKRAVRQRGEEGAAQRTATCHHIDTKRDAGVIRGPLPPHRPAPLAHLVMRMTRNMAVGAASGFIF